MDALTLATSAVAPYTLNMRRHINQRGFSLIEVLAGLLILVAVIGAGMMGVQMISRGSSNQDMRTRAEGGLQDAAEVLRNLAGIPGNFDTLTFGGTYYLVNGDLSQTKTDAWDEQNLKIQAIVGEMNLIDRTRSVTILAQWREGITGQSRTLSFILSRTRPSSVGGDVTGRILDAASSSPPAGVKHIVIQSIGEGDGRTIVTKTDAAGYFVLKGVAIGPNTPVIIRGDGKAAPYYYFRDLDGAGPLDEWENSSISISTEVAVSSGVVVSIGDFEMWPFSNMAVTVKDYDTDGFVANALVEIVPLRTEIANFQDKQAKLTGQFGATLGKYTFTNLCPGYYKLYLHGRGAANPSYNAVTDPYTYTQLPNVRTSTTSPEAYTASPSAYYSAVASPDDLVKANSTQFSTMTISASYIRVGPGETYDSEDGTHAGSHAHAGVDIDHKDVSNHELNTKLLTTKMGDLRGTVYEAAWDGTSFAQGSAVGAGAVIMAKNRPTDLYPSVMPPHSPYNQNFPTTRVPFDMSNTNAWNNGERWPDDSRGGYVRHSVSSFRAAQTNSSGNYSFNNMALPIINKADGSVFNQQTQVELFPGFQPTLAPILVLDPVTAGNPQYFVLFLGVDGGRRVGHAEQYMVVPSTWVYSPTYYWPATNYTGYENFNGQTEEADLITQFLMGKALKTVNLKLLRRDQLANIYGKIVEADNVTPYVISGDPTATGLVYSWAMRVSGTKSYIDVGANVATSWANPTFPGEHAYTFSGYNGAGVGENRIVPSIVSRPDPGGTDNAGGNERYAVFIANEVQDTVDLLFTGRILAQKKEFDAGTNTYNVVSVSPFDGTVELEGYNYYGDAASGVRWWFDGEISQVGLPNNGVYNFVTTAAQRADRRVRHFGVTPPEHIQPGSDHLMPNIVAAANNGSYYQEYVRVNQADTEWLDVTAYNANNAPYFTGLRFDPSPNKFTPSSYTALTGHIELFQKQTASQISGTVYEPDGITPLAGVKVYWYKTANKMEAWTSMGYKTTDSSGQFLITSGDNLSFVGIPGSNFRLYFETPSGQPWVNDSSNNRYQEGYDSMVWVQDFVFQLPSEDGSGGGDDSELGF